MSIFDLQIETERLLLRPPQAQAFGFEYRACWRKGHIRIRLSPLSRMRERVGVRAAFAFARSLLIRPSGTFSPREKEKTRTQNALMPVSWRPITSWCTVSVPS